MNITYGPIQFIPGQPCPGCGTAYLTVTSGAAWHPHNPDACVAFKRGWEAAEANKARENDAYVRGLAAGRAENTCRECALTEAEKERDAYVDGLNDGWEAARAALAAGKGET